MEPENELGPAERERLFPAEVEAPRALEERVVASLRARGLLRASIFPRALVAAAAAIALFLAGSAVGSRRAAEVPKGQEYLLLLYEDASYQAPSAAEHPARVHEYSEWARGLARKGLLVAGEELGEGGKVLEAQPAGVRDHVPAGEAGVVAGYFVIAASNLDEALLIARGCPHLRHGGRVSLRAIVRG